MAARDAGGAAGGAGRGTGAGAGAARGAGTDGRARAGRGADHGQPGEATGAGGPGRSGSGGAAAARRDPNLRAARYRVERDAAADDAAADGAAAGRPAADGAAHGAGHGAAHDGAAQPERLPTVDELHTIARIRLDQAIARGEFDDLPGAGKPLPGLTGTHDPDWWIKGLIERENLSGLAPPALSLRTEHERFDASLDALTTERAVREAVEDFNARVVEARRQLTGGPPVVTPTRDVDDDLRRWRERRDERRRAAAAAAPPPPPTWRERRRAAREARRGR